MANINNDILKEYPNKFIRAVDGMAVTSEVWEDAHNYHRQSGRFHNLYSHGSGIVAGLQVIASDPPDTAVYILPGVAIDTAGHMVVIVEPTAYDIGRQVDGPLHLVLTYGESRPRSEGNQSTQEGAPLFVHSEFGVQAVPQLPVTPYVELARIRRQGRASAISDAADAAHPGPNELDLRWRQVSQTSVRQTVGVGVVYAGMTDHRHGDGLLNVANYINHHSSQLNVVVDDNAQLTGGLDDYALVCIVAQRAFQFSGDEQAALQAYVQGGGTLFLESCRRDATAAPGSDQSFHDLATAFSAKLADAVQGGHTVLKAPSFFPALPAGYEPQGTLLAGEGVIFSTADYGCLWAGQQRSGPASREAIRAGLEFGENLIEFAAQRRQAAGK